MADYACFLPKINPNKLFQTTPAAEKFRKLPGFDDLVSLRGLQKVTVKIISWSHVPTNNILEPSIEETLAFKFFLVGLLTQAKQDQGTVRIFF
jgi:hypothetical protein